MKRIRIMFVNCPTLSIDAATYLVLAQNKVQSFIEFEVVHHWISAVHTQPITATRDKLIRRVYDSFPAWKTLQKIVWAELDRRAAPSFAQELKTKDWHESAKGVAENYDRWFSNCRYNKFDTLPQPTIIVTESKLEGGYLGYCYDGVAIVSLAGWKSFFKPGSALEYILGSVQRCSLRLLYKNIGSHYPTRGCIWDFDVHQPDCRIAAYLGHLCSTCRSALVGVMPAEELNSIERLIANEWIGSNDDPTSISANLRKIFGYPVRRSTGLHPGLMESLSQGMRTELGKFVFDISKVVLAALGTLYVASKFPEVYRIMSGS